MYKKIMYLMIMMTLMQNVDAAFGVRWVEPTGNKLAGKVLLNVTVPENIGVKNCTFTAEANNVNQEIPYIFGTDIKPQPLGTDVDFNITINTKELQDSIWSFTAICYSPDNWGATVLSDMIIDNTIPEKPHDLVPINGAILGYDEVEFSAKVDSAKTTYCLIEFYGNHPGQIKYTTDHEKDGVCRIKLNISESSYEWTMTATDGLNLARSDTQRFQVSIPTPDKKTDAFIAASKQEEEQNKAEQMGQQIKNMGWQAFIFIVAIAIVIIYFRKKY